MQKWLNREILRIALPAIVANVTIPLLGLIDLTIAGHLGNAAFIGAMSVGAMMFNLTYWNFGFLRMGTSGITAQAYGRGDLTAACNTLMQACFMALVIAVAIVILQYPLQWLTLTIINPSSQVHALARQYFMTVVWGAPAVLIMMAVKGWFLGMQDSQSAMRISICVDSLNVVASLVAVYGLNMGFLGIAVGTLMAEYLGLAYSAYLLMSKHRALLMQWRPAALAQWHSLKRLLSVNSHIFLRSFCLILVTLSFVSIGARSGDMVLAVNAMIMQLFILFSYFMDGIAFAGEALVGRFVGSGNHVNRRSCVAHLMMWGTVVMALFAIAYGALPRQIFTILTDDAQVVDMAMTYRWWCVAIPLASMAAFVWDGVFIGQTNTRGMLMVVMAASATFFAVYFALPWPQGNTRLWLAFITYLAMRSAVQTAIWLHDEKKTLRKNCKEPKV
ncbi:MAG: MATE family efflux transporter [Muribaculaceae bacterium]